MSDRDPVSWSMQVDALTGRVAKLEADALHHETCKVQRLCSCSCRGYVEPTPTFEELVARVGPGPLPMTALASAGARRWCTKLGGGLCVERDGHDGACVPHRETVVKPSDTTVPKKRACRGTSCFCVDNTYGHWCPACADAWCSQDENDQDAECRAKDEPPAEQPSQKETPGGEAGTIPEQPTRLGPAAPLTTAEQEEAAGRIVDACRDRAKAKAAEQTLSKLVKERDEAMLSMLRQAPAEPSGTGQLLRAPVGFRVVGRSGPDVRQQVGLWIRRARDMRTGEEANGEVRRITSPSLGGVWDAGEYDILEPIAEPPAPAVGTLLANATVTCGYCGEYGYLGLDHWERCAKHPAHAKLAQAERERDEWRDEATSSLNVAVTAERERDEYKRRLDIDDRQLELRDEAISGFMRERDEATAKLATKDECLADAFAQADARVSEATAKERARCLAWMDACVTVDRLDGVEDIRTYVGIRSGNPAPGTSS